MQDLRIAIVAELDRGYFVELEAHRETGLCVKVCFYKAPGLVFHGIGFVAGRVIGVKGAWPHDRKRSDSHPIVEVQPLAIPGRPLMRHIQRVLQAILILQRDRIITGSLRRRNNTREYLMMDDAEPKIDLIVRITIILQVFFEIEIPDIRSNMNIVVIGIDLNFITIVTIDK